MKREDIEYIMNSKQGRAVMWNFLGFCGVHHSVGGEYHEMLLQEGKRRVGIRLEAMMLEHCEDQYFTMLKESRIAVQEAKDEQEDNDRAEERRRQEGLDFDHAEYFGTERSGAEERGDNLFI